MKNCFKLVKSFVVAPFVIYLYNLIATSFNLVIPINIFSILVVGLLGMPGLVTILLIFICI